MLRAISPLAMPFKAIWCVTGSSYMSCKSAGIWAFSTSGESMLSCLLEDMTDREQGICRKIEVAAADVIEAGQSEKTHWHFCHICARHTLHMLTFVKAGCSEQS